MDTLEFLERIGAQSVAGRAWFMRSPSDRVLVGRLSPDGMVLTEEGRAMRDAMVDKTKPAREALAADAEPKPKRRASRKKAAPEPEPEAPSAAEDDLEGLNFDD